MITSIDDIRNLLNTGKFPMGSNVIKSGKLTTNNGSEINYDLHIGWDLVKCHACDQEWGPYNVRLLNFIANQNYDQATLNKVLDDIQMDDDHWDWLNKAICYHNKNYHWFFLVADGKQQAVCLIYHPTKGVIDGEDVFYVEYIAVAPWNRNNPMESRLLKGLGSLLIASVIEYCTKTLKFRHAFSLHSLPRACDFYVKIGMINYPPHDKDILKYFEMPESIASKFMVSQ